MNNKYVLRSTGRERDVLLRCLVSFCSRLVYTGQHERLDAVNGHDLDVGLILEQKDTKGTKEDPIPFSF